MANERRLIDANAALEKLCQYCICGCYEECDNRCVEYASISRIPTVDAVEVVHGRWETDKEDMEWGNSLKRKHCTNCGKRPHFDKEKREFVLSDFCHHCGAKMDGERKDNGK